jgi:thymidylate synthase
VKQYLDLVRHVLEHGDDRHDRTGTGTRSIFGHQLRFDLRDGFPLITTRRLPFRTIVHELLWMLSGSTSVCDLHRHRVHIWDPWADEDGNLGPIYGAQWRRWPTTRDNGAGHIDQIEKVVREIRTNPCSRRLLVSAWNVADLELMSLPPCHTLFQFHVADGRLSCQVYQRSADIFIGLPFNIASYALLTTMVAHVCDLAPGELVHTLGDAHLYRTHLSAARTLLAREPYEAPRVSLNPRVRSLFDVACEDVVLHGYRAHPHITVEVAV